MQDSENCTGRILGITAPWRVERVELQLKQGVVILADLQASLNSSPTRQRRP